MGPLGWGDTTLYFLVLNITSSNAALITGSWNEPRLPKAHLQAPMPGAGHGGKTLKSPWSWATCSALIKTKKGKNF